MVDNELFKVPSNIELSLIEIVRKPISYYELPDSYWGVSKIVERVAPIEKRTIISTLHYLSENYIGFADLYWNMLDLDNLLPLMTSKIKKYFYDYEDEVIKTSKADGMVTEWYVNLLINIYPKVLEMTELIDELVI